MLQKSSSYSGSGSYVFVSYSHRDAKRVEREIRHLEQAGIPVWYDHAIRPGHRWRVELAHAIDGCSAFLLFTSNAAIQSANCEQELTYASEQQRPLLQVQLEETDLPTEFKFTLAAHQAIHAWEISRRDYRARMVGALQSKITGVPAPVPDSPAHRTVSRSGARKLITTAAVGTLVLAIAFVASLLLKPGDLNLPGVDQAPPFVASERSIAVMRFITIGENTALGDGLCEQLLHLLMKLQEISVPSRTSSWMAADQNLDPQQVAQRLGVRYVLEGSVQQIEDRLRVTAQLIDGFTGLHVWSDTYDERLSAGSFFDIQDNIATQLVSHLEITLSGASAAQLAERPTDSDEALQAYLAGRELRRGPNTLENIENAQADFNQSLSFDADYAEAHAALCESHLSAYAVRRDDDRFETAKAHCLEAQRIDDTQTMVLIALGTLYRHEGRLQDAEVEIDKALSMQPRDTAVMEERGRLLRTMGRYQEAETAFEEAIRTEPGNWSVYKSLGNFLVRTGRYGEAIGLYQQSLRLDPGNEVSENNLATTLHLAGEFGPAGELWTRISTDSPSFLAFMNLANARFYEGAYEEAVDWYSRAIELSDQDFRAFGGRAASLEYARGPDAAQADYQRAAELAVAVAERNRNDPQALSRLSFYQAKLGQAELAQAGLDRLDDMAGVDPDSLFMIALTHITLGDEETAQQALDEAVAAGFSVALVRADPLVAQIRNRQTPATGNQV